MSIQPKHLSSALIVHLALMAPDSSYAGQTELCAPSGVPLARRNLTAPAAKQCAVFEYDQNTWDYFTKNDFRFPQIPKNRNHDFVTLPHDFIAAWMPAPGESQNLDPIEQRLQSKRTWGRSGDAKQHAEAVAREYLVNGISEKRSFLHAPDGFNAQQYWLNNQRYISHEYPLLEDMESKDWITPTTAELLEWNWNDNQVDIEVACIRHFYNFGLFDYQHHKDSNSDAKVLYERSALHWYAIPEMFSDWRRILSLSTKMQAELNDKVGANAPDPAKAMWTFHRVFKHGTHNYKFHEHVPERFDWEAYARIVTGLRNSTEQTTPHTSLAEEEDIYHLDGIHHLDDVLQGTLGVQNREDPHSKKQMLETVVAVQEHFVKYAQSLGLLYPLFPTSFAPMSYLKKSEVWQRFVAQNSQYKRWNKRQKIAWAKADYFLGLFKWVKSGVDSAPAGFTLPTHWNHQHHWEIEDDVAKHLEAEPDETIKELKTVAWSQAAMHKAWNEAGAEGEVAKEFSRFEQSLPEWYSTKEYLDPVQNPGLEDAIETDLATERGKKVWEKMSVGEQRMLVEAKAQSRFMEGDGKRTIAPEAFVAKQYWRQNRSRFKEHEAFKKQDPLALEHHYAEVGMKEGLHYIDMKGIPELPTWADEEHYFNQTPILQKMAAGLSKEAKRALMRQHYFTQGYTGDLSLVEVPAGLLTWTEFDEAIYEQEAGDLRGLLDYIKNSSGGKAKRLLLLGHYARVGQQTGIRATNEMAFSGADMLPSQAHIGTNQGDGSVKVEANSQEGLVTRLERDLAPGTYRIKVDLESSAEEGMAIGEWEITTKDRATPMTMVSLASKNSHKRFSYAGKVTLTSTDGPLVLKVHARNQQGFVVHGMKIQRVHTQESGV